MVFSAFVYLFTLYQICQKQFGRLQKYKKNVKCQRKLKVFFRLFASLLFFAETV